MLFRSGKAAALSLSREGARVAVAARDQGRLDDAVSEISSQTENPVIGVSTDVRDESSVAALIARVTDEWGGLDILVNNAGTSSTSRLEDMTNEKMTADIELKVYGAVYGTRHALPFLKQSDSAVIINTTTPGGKAPTAGTQPTALSRAAGISLTKTWSKEFAEFNIRVNTICPGMIETPLNRGVWQAWNDRQPEEEKQDYHEWAAGKIGNVVPLGRWQQPEDVADMAVFLSSKRSHNVTGQTINVDGGFIMHS